MLTRQDAKKLHAVARGKVRTQHAALCYRISQGSPEILLITTRGTGSWMLPKGWPMSGKSAGSTAAQEAWEEAGVRGKCEKREIGRFFYMKTVEDGEDIPCVISVHPIEVKRLEQHFPEAGQRRRKWFSPRKAASKVTVPSLARILRDFNPRPVH